MALVELTGTVDAQIYRGDDGHTVLAIRDKEGDSRAVGILHASVERGDEFIALGEWKHHPKYGRQFAFQSLTVPPPSTHKQVVARLKTYPKIGPKTADLIVEMFGDRTWAVMDNSIGDLVAVRGISINGLAEIEAHHALQHGPLAKVQIRLIELGVSTRLAKPIYDFYKGGALDMLEQHPYRVAANVDRFGFGTAETIALESGLDMESDERIEAGILHALKAKQSFDGHCGMPPADLGRETVSLLGKKGPRIPVALVDAGVNRLLKSGALRFQHSLLYTSRMARTESAVAHAIGRLSTSVHAVWNVGELPSHLSPGQVDAVKAVARAGFTIVTGGPGTGKSTLLASVLDVAKREGVHIILCSPTGRAAKRMAEATGHEAKTIHRTLGVIPGPSMQFRHGKDDPLKAGLIVIDEASMLDINLADSLLAALTSEHRVLLVGDADQLPSVGPGRVLRDIIEAAEQGSTIPVVRLKKVFRQAAGSTIITNAHRILAGDSLEPDPPSRAAEGEFFVIPVADREDDHGNIITAADQARGKIIDMATTRVPAAFGLDRMLDVQVLCPMHKGPAGTEAINVELQRRYTARSEGFGNAKYRQFFRGDRVMNTKNDYDREVFNGEIGTVTDIRLGGQDAQMTVDYDGVIAEYSQQDLGPLRLAYAMSIHKSQGSEFPVVLIPVLMCHSIMLRRNLIYTAITRAKRLCVIVGELRAIRQAIGAADAEKRWTGLAPRMLEMMRKAA